MQSPIGSFSRPPQQPRAVPGHQNPQIPSLLALGCRLGKGAARNLPPTLLLLLLLLGLVLGLILGKCWGRWRRGRFLALPGRAGRLADGEPVAQIGPRGHFAGAGLPCMAENRVSGCGCARAHSPDRPCGARSSCAISLPLPLPPSSPLSHTASRSWDGAAQAGSWSVACWGLCLGSALVDVPLGQSPPQTDVQCCTRQDPAARP